MIIKFRKQMTNRASMVQKHLLELVTSLAPEGKEKTRIVFKKLVENYGQPGMATTVG